MSFEDTNFERFQKSKKSCGDANFNSSDTLPSHTMKSMKFTKNVKFLTWGCYQLKNYW